MRSVLHVLLGAVVASGGFVALGASVATLIDESFNGRLMLP